MAAGAGQADRSETAGGGFVMPRSRPSIAAGEWAPRCCGNWPTTAPVLGCVAGQPRSSAWTHALDTSRRQTSITVARALPLDG